MIDIARTTKLVDQCWGDEIVPTLIEYIRIPNKSPSFDPDWAAHGYMEDAVALFEGWVRAKLPSLPGARLEVVRLPGRTPVILIDVPGFSVPYAYLCAAQVRLGRLDDARDTVRRMLGIDPGFRISRFRVTVGVDESVFDDFAQTWREAGVPD